MRRFIAVVALALAALTAGHAYSQEPSYTIEGYLWGDVYFDTLSSELDDPAMTELEKLRDWLIERPGSTVLLASYDDQRTNGERSIEIGWERAYAVRDYLVSIGVDPNSVKAISFGNTKGTLAGSGEKVWARERRVRYRVVPAETEIKMEGRPSGVCQKCKK